MSLPIISAQQRMAERKGVKLQEINKAYTNDRLAA